MANRRNSSTASTRRFRRNLTCTLLFRKTINSIFGNSDHIALKTRAGEAVNFDFNYRKTAKIEIRLLMFAFCRQVRLSVAQSDPPTFFIDASTWWALRMKGRTGTSTIGADATRTEFCCPFLKKNVRIPTRRVTIVACYFLTELILWYVLFMFMSNLTLHVPFS